MFESKRRALIFFFLSVAAALAAVFLFSDYVQRTQENMGEMIPVVIAKNAISAGEEIAPDKLGTKQIPKKYVLPSLLKSVDELKYKRSVVAIKEGDLITTSMLVDTTLVTGELRQIQLRAPLAVFDDNIQFNDKVDLIYTYEVPDQRGGTADQSDTRLTKILFEDVTVNSVTKTNDQISAIGVILPLSDSEKMVWALNFGKEVRVLKRNGDGQREGTVAVQPENGTEPEGTASPSASPTTTPKAATGTTADSGKKTTSPSPGKSPTPKPTAKATPKPSSTPK